MHADVLSCMTGVTLFGTATSSAVPRLRGAGGSLVGASGTEPGNPTLALDKTEDETLLREDFWTRFDYVLMEDPSKVKSGEWETVGLVQGYGGVELLRPGTGEEESGRVVGNGAIVQAWKRQVRSFTGGWWIGPRLVPRIRIMKRTKGSERARKAAES